MPELGAAGESPMTGTDVAIYSIAISVLVLNVVLARALQDIIRELRRRR